MRISDWSSDVCSSDLGGGGQERRGGRGDGRARDRRAERIAFVGAARIVVFHGRRARAARAAAQRSGDEARSGGQRIDRKSVVEGKSVSGRVDPGGRRIMQKKKHTYYHRFCYSY